ncbi:MAG: hypothetical protein ACE361_03540 [Aureliella sp.]
MRRNRIILLGLGLTVAATFLPFRSTTAQQGVRVNPAERLTERSIVALKDQLKNGLRATTPAQFAFINTVDARVKAGQLPRAMVNLVYDWAIKRNPRVPFPYFQFALRALAKRRGINLP